MFFSHLLPDRIIRTYLDMLVYNNWKEFEPHTIIISAHPDDETISMGSRLSKLRKTELIYITNGAPVNPYYYTKAGFNDTDTYAKARKRELNNALAYTKLSTSNCIFLEIPDQEASFNIPHIAKELTTIFEMHEPDIIITHPYEGGHPDHDAAALAVHLALQNNLKNKGFAPIALEFTSYHGENGNIVTNKFLNIEDYLYREVLLDEKQKKEKQEMINCFTSQLEFLKVFSTSNESFRQIPLYDFMQPPHEGKLYYEQFDWGVTGEQWRDFAREALNKFGFNE